MSSCVPYHSYSKIGKNMVTLGKFSLYRKTIGSIETLELSKLNSREFRATSLSIYDFLYTTLPHNLIKETLLDLIGRTFKRQKTLYHACNDKKAFSLLHTIVIQTNCWYSDGYKLCSTCSRFVFILL